MGQKQEKSQKNQIICADCMFVENQPSILCRLHIDSKVTNNCACNYLIKNKVNKNYLFKKNGLALDKVHKNRGANLLMTRFLKKISKSNLPCKNVSIYTKNRNNFVNKNCTFGMPF